MLFCPKCGSLLKPKKEGNKKVMGCSCGYKHQDLEVAKIKEVAKKEEEQREEGAIEGEEQSLPLTEAECPKCKHGKAYYWLVQTRAADEAETRFFRCEKCKHTWRDYT